MSTVASIIEDALIEIGVLQAGETPTAQQAAFCLGRFQKQLQAWQADSLALYNFNRTTYTLPPSTQTRTIGPSGDIVTAANPVFINGINYVVPSSSPGVETPMGRMNDDQFMMLSIKQLSSTLPTQWHFNAGVTNSTLTFWPVVSGNVTIAIYAYFGVGSPVAVTDTVSGPPGYEEAFMYQLAIRLMTPFGIAPATLPLLPQMSAEAFARIKRPNVDPGLLGVDQALVTGRVGGASGYNILNDTTSAAGGS